MESSINLKGNIQHISVIGGKFRRRKRMKSLNVLIALAIFTIGISSVLADTDVVRNSISSDAGRIDYAMTYVPSVLGPAATPAVSTTASTAVVNLVQTNSVLSAFITGVSINKAIDINSYIFARSSGGDFAASGMEIDGSDDAAGGDASVSNYGMYGYATNNLAYTGQYADKMQGEWIGVWSKSLNNVDTTTIPALGAAGTTADYTLIIDQDPFAGVTSTEATNAYSKAWAGAWDEGLLPVTDITGPAYSATKLYNYAQAGGSLNPSAYPMGIWAQSANDKGHKLAIAGTGALGDAISEDTFGEYDSSYNRYMATESQITQTKDSTGLGQVSIAPNAVNMGYGDKNIAYSNVDTSLAGNDNVPFYDTDSFTSMNSGTSKTTEKTRNQRPIDSGDGNELFVYSIVDANNPNGFSDALFF
jgi:hypothetical protein